MTHARRAYIVGTFWSWWALNYFPGGAKRNQSKNI